MHMRYIQLWKILCCPLFFFFCFKSHIQSFFPCCVPPSSPPQKVIFTRSQSTFIRVLGGAERRRGAGGIPPYQSTSKWLVWTWKAVSRNWFKFHLYYTQEKKDRKEKGVCLENEATLQVKVGGLFFCWVFFFLVSLSHSYWPPRILLYNGLSTFFFFITI